MYDCWIEVNKDNEAIYDTIVFKKDFHEKYNL